MKIIIMSLKRNQTINLDNDFIYKGTIKKRNSSWKWKIINPISNYKGKWKEGVIRGRGTLELNLDFVFFIGGFTNG